MRRAPLALALVSLTVALASVALVGWAVVREDDAANAADVAALRTDLAASRRDVAALRVEIRGLRRTVAKQRPYIRAVFGLCHAFRHVSGLTGDDYAIDVARALVEGVSDACAFGNVPATAEP